MSHSNPGDFAKLGELIRDIRVALLTTGGRVLSMSKVALSLRQRHKHTRISLIERDCYTDMQLTK